MKVKLSHTALMSACLISFLTLGAHSAAAKCGAIFKPSLNVSKFSVGSTGGYSSGGTQYDREFEPELRLGFEIPLGNYCKDYNAKLAAEAEAKAAESRDKAAQHIEQMIQNLERINRMCDNSWIPSICNKQDKLARDIYVATQKLNDY